jgi:hypothetical protein
MNTNNALFKQNLPELGHHVYTAAIEPYDERGFSFMCGCGKTHLTKDAFAVREHREVGTTIYACPQHDQLLNLVEPVGFFRVKGIKCIASYFSDSETDVYSKIFVFQQLEEKGMNSLREYYQE